MGTPVTAFVDAHVHLHDCFDVQKFFDGAARNFELHASNAPVARAQGNVLCFTEIDGANKFDELANGSHRDSDYPPSSESQWRFSHSEDDEYLIASHTDHGEIIVVSGRQIVTAEKLEILAIGTRVSWKDGLDASDVIESVLSSGAIPVLPWGFGKWWGRRGREVRRLVEQFSSTSLYLGDNSGRPDVLPGPSIFAWARELGTRILRGSDPLPFAAECGRAGSFGFYVKIPDRGDDIWPTLRRNLQSGDCELNNYGSLESPFRFVRNQIAMQFRKRLMSHRVSI